MNVTEIVDTLQNPEFRKRMNDWQRNTSASILSQRMQKGSLTEKQWNLLEKIIAETKARASKPAAVDLGDFSGVVNLIKMAQDKGAKRIGFRFQSDVGEEIRISVAGQRSNNPGVIHVTGEGSFEERPYYGKITPKGQLLPSGRAEITPSILAMLKAFAADPAKVGSAYGHATGNCCFCSTELTDERSLAAGYGPICAKKYNLPWG